MRKILTLVACLLLAACARQFPVAELTPEQQKSEAELRAMQEDEARLALAQLYVQSNRIDEADAILVDLAKKDPKNPQVMAWHAANDCKKAGRRGPWLMGFDKLYLVSDCLERVEGALKAAPDDFIVQMVQMGTAAEVDMFGSLDRARTTRSRVDAFLQKNPNGIPPDAVSEFQVTAALIERQSGNKPQADARLKLAEQTTKTAFTRGLIQKERAALAAM